MGRIITRDQLMRHLDIGGDNPARVPVEVLDDIIASAEAFAETYAHRVFTPLNTADTPVVLTFKVRGKRRVRVPDLREATVVDLGGNVLAEDVGYELDSYAGGEPSTSLLLVAYSPYTSWSLSRTQTLTITGKWGFNPTPPQVVDAVLLIAARRYRKRDAMYSDQVDTGTGAYDYRAAFPKEACEMLDAFRVPNVALV